VKHGYPGSTNQTAQWFAKNDFADFLVADLKKKFEETRGAEYG
jgi:hypothetical protein